MRRNSNDIVDVILYVIHHEMEHKRDGLRVDGSTIIKNQIEVIVSKQNYVFNRGVDSMAKEFASLIT